MATIDDRKAEADIYDKKSEEGRKISEEGKLITMKLLELVGLPDGLILPDDIQECGYVKKTGFVWTKWKVEYKFKAIGRLVQYDTEIRGYVEHRKVTKVTSKEKMEELREWIKEVSGVKSMELREWITIKEISIDPGWITISEISVGPASAKIWFKSDIGNNKSVSPSAAPEKGGSGVKHGLE